MKLPVFGLVGTVHQKIGGSSPGDEWVEMQTERPQETHIATVGGVWVEAQETREYKHFAPNDFLALFAPERRDIKQATMQDVDIGIWYDDTVAAQFITYSDPRVESGLSALVSAGLLTELRKSEIVSQMMAWWE